MTYGCKTINKQEQHLYLVTVDQPEVGGRVSDDVTFVGQSSLTFDLIVVDDVIQQAINSKTQKSVCPQTLAYQKLVLHLMLRNNFVCILWVLSSPLFNCVFVTKWRSLVPASERWRSVGGTDFKGLSTEYLEDGLIRRISVDVNVFPTTACCDLDLWPLTSRI